MLNRAKAVDWSGLHGAARGVDAECNATATKRTGNIRSEADLLEFMKGAAFEGRRGTCCPRCGPTEPTSLTLRGPTIRPSGARALGEQVEFSRDSKLYICTFKDFSDSAQSPSISKAQSSRTCAGAFGAVLGLVEAIAGLIMLCWDRPAARCLVITQSGV